MDLIVAIVLIIAALILGAVVSGILTFKKGVSKGIETRKQQAESMMGSAEKEAERILKDAEKDADSKKKGALVEAKDEYISFARKPRRKSKTAEQSCPVRKDVCSKKKKISIRKLTILRKKKKLSARKLNPLRKN